MRGDTGFPQVDAADDFLRVRRRAAMGHLLTWLRGDAEQHRAISFDEMLDALGQRGQRLVGTHVIPVDRITGSVDRAGDFDEAFRPTSERSRVRWERVAEAARRGVDLPPIEVYRIGDRYFVADGHHRVSVARAMGVPEITATVTEVRTAVSSRGLGSRADLQMRMFERVLQERIAFGPDVIEQLRVAEPRSLATLAESIEAWATRTMLAERVLLDREAIARRWYDEEYRTVTGLITEAGLVGADETPADAYLRLSCQKFWICRCHSWTPEVMQALLAAQ